MDAYTFWNVIGNYNEHTLIIQIIMLVFFLTISINFISLPQIVSHERTKDTDYFVVATFGYIL